MFRGLQDKQRLANDVARHFSAALQNTNHSRRIGYAEAKGQHVNVVRLEDDQPLQECVMAFYHWLTVLFETSPALKLFVNSNANVWVKNFAALT